MDSQTYYKTLFSSFRSIEEEEEKRKRYDPFDLTKELGKFSTENPDYRQNLATAKGLASLYEGQPVQSWIPADVAGAFKHAIEQAENPGEMEVRLNTAYYLAKSREIPFSQAFQNVEAILESDYGKALSPASGLEAVINVWKAQVIHREISRYTYELKNRALYGAFASMQDVMADPSYEKVRLLESQLPPEDAIKRTWPIEWAKKAMQVIPSWTESLAKGATAGMVAQIAATALMGARAGSFAGPLGTLAGAAAGVTGGAIVSIIPTIAKLSGATFGAIATAKNSQEAEGGAAFYDMIRFSDPVTGQKINPLVAARWATAYEGLASMVEMSQTEAFFTPLREGMSIIQKRAVKEAISSSAKSIADASARAGTLLRLANSTAGKWFLEWGENVAKETLEEDLQEGLQIWATESAKRVTNRLEGTSLTPASKQEILQRIIDTTVGSILGMGLLQAGPATFRVWAETKSVVKEFALENAQETPKPPHQVPSITKGEPFDLKGTNANAPSLLYFKSYEPSPGIVEIHGTTQTEGANRKATVISVLTVNDEEKTATISSISWENEIRKNPEEALRQGIEILKNAKADLPGYQIIFQPDTKIQKAVRDAIEVEDPQFFSSVENGLTKGLKKKIEENVAPTGENAVASQQKALDEQRTDDDGSDVLAPTPNREEVSPAPIVPESKAEEFEEEDSLATLQREGAERIHSKLDESGYKYTDEKYFDVDRIQFHPDLPNFKEGANKEGVVNPIKGKPEPLGMPPVLVFHTKDDKYYMVTGRHRLDLWRRNNLPTIPTQIIHESDGYTLDDMAVLDAEMNIRDNQGTEKDYARYFGRVKYTYERAEGRGLLRTSKSKSGFYIGTFASPALRSLFFSNRISADKAAAIAEAAPDNEGLQAVGIKLASDRSNTPEVIKNALTMFASTRGGSKAQQLEMFGSDTSALDAQVKIAKGAESIKNEITGELSVLKQAARLGEKDRSRFIEKYGYKMGDAVSLSARIEELSDLATKWEGISWTSDPELFFKAKVRAGLATEEEIAAHAKPLVPVDTETPEMAFETAPNYGNKDPITSPSPWIYKAEEVVDKKMQGPMPGRQILRMLQSSGVKVDELKWVDLETFLGTDEKKTPQEVKEYIAGNKIIIKEVQNWESDYHTFAQRMTEKYGNGWLNELTPEEQAQEKFLFDEADNAPEKTKFSTYTLPGGENYREVLFTLPWDIAIPSDVTDPGTRANVRDGMTDRYTYKSPHWDEPNVLAHTRLDDRTVDGKKMLFIEEIQSDWHQEGRRKGYSGSMPSSIKEMSDKQLEQFILTWDSGAETDGLSRVELMAMVEDMGLTDSSIAKRAVLEAVPDAPFKKTWHEFVFKRILRMAVEEGYDSIGWTTGEQQAERYDLSQQVSKIRYRSVGKDTYSVGVLNKEGNNLLGYDAATPAELEKALGKEITQKIIKGEGKKDSGYTYLEGVDLKVGGEGMNVFYDEILVDFANKYGKKWGVRVESVDLRPLQDMNPYAIINPETDEIIKTFATYKEAHQWQRENDNWNDITVIEKDEDHETIHSISITDFMRSSIPEGQYLFERAETKYGFDVPKAQFRKQQLKAREIRKLMADNIDSFFNDEVRSFIVQNNNAIIDALENSRAETVAYNSTADGGTYSATIAPAKDGSGAWDVNLHIDGELVGIDRYKDRTDAIIGLFTDTAPLFGGTSTWKITEGTEEFQLTPDQMGDLAQKEEQQLDLFEYDEKTITLVYGSKEAFESANKGIQLGLFDQDDAGDLFAYPGDSTNTGSREEIRNGNSRRRKTPVSPLLGPAGKSLHPQVKENRKGQKRVSFVGQPVSSPRDIAELFQVYRNSQVETFHIIYLDDEGKILAHNALSSGVAGRTFGFEYMRTKNAIKKNDYFLNERMKRLGASQVYILHNHPSGNPTPSAEDVIVTLGYIRLLGDSFKGHVVLNHSKSAFISTDLVMDGFRSHTPPDIVAKATPIASYIPNQESFKAADGLQIQNPEDAEMYALSTMNDRTGGTLIITDYQYRILEWRVWDSTNIESIYQAVKESGGSFAFFATDNRTQYNLVTQNAVQAGRSGGKYNVFTDIIFVDKEKRNYDHAFGQLNGLPGHYVYRVERGIEKTHGVRYVMEPLVNEASEFESYEGFKDAYLAEGENEEEVKKAWAESQQKKGPTSSDEEFVSAMQNREKLMDFLMANGADLFDRKVPRKNLSVVDATSYRLATGGEVSPATISRTLGLIEKYAFRWRARYQELIGIKGETEQEDFEISGNAPDISILQARHKEAIEKLPESLKANDSYKSIKDSAEKLSEGTMKIRKKLEQSKKELKEYEDRFSYAEKRIVDMQRQVRDLDKRIWAERAKSKLRGGDRGQLKAMEDHKKDLETQILERTNALSPQAAMKNTAYLAKKEAIRETTKELREKQALEKAKRTERDLKIYYASRIKRPVSKGIDFKVGMEIKKLQALVDPYFRKMAEGKETEPFIGPSGKPLNLWDLEDLQRLYEEIEAMRDYGRTVYQTRIMERSLQRSEIRGELQETAMKTGKERPAYFYGTQEQIEQARKDKGIYKGFDLSLETIHRVARELDGGKEGAFYKTLVEGEREAFRNEKEHFDRRIAGIDAKMAELGLNRDAMYQEKVSLGEQTISKWEAIALYIGSQNARTEAALVYGNMMSQEDREQLPDEAFYAKALQNRQYIKEAISTLRPEEIELARYLIQDGEKEFDRFAEATYIYENRIPEKEGVYYPHERKMRSGEGDTPEEILDQVLSRAAKAQRNVGKQPTINRIDIGPRHQTPISLDAFQVYRRGIERQEHYIAYARYISDMNSVWKNAQGAAAFREKMRLFHGQGVLDYVDRWISEAANPKAFADFNKPTAGLDKVFKILRGPLGVAYLGYRASRGVFQLITSPAPFLPYAGQFMISRMVKNLNPAEFMKTLSFAKKNSAFIRHRVINPTDAYIKQYLDKTQDKLKRNAMAAAGAIMEWSDLWSVSTGWMAVYEKKIAELKGSTMTQEEVMKEAIREADKVTIETQPTYRHQDLSPAFKKDSELERFLFQFQTPLNVIYNQLFHDTKHDWKSGHKGRALGIISGYLAVMGLMSVITAPRQDDDEDDKKAKYFISGALSLPLETIPFVGSIAAGYLESLITGERFYRDDQIFPGVKKMLDGATRMMTAQEFEQGFAAFIRFMEGSGMLAGIPTSALKEYYRVIFEGDWGALLGKRKGD